MKWEWLEKELVFEQDRLAWYRIESNRTGWDRVVRTDEMEVVWLQSRSKDMYFAPKVVNGKKKTISIHSCWLLVIIGVCSCEVGVA